MNLSAFLTRSRLLLLAAMLLAAQWATNMQLKGIEGTWVEPPQEKETHWNPQLFRALTFGQMPASVDWLWMRVLQDQAMTKVLPGTHAGIFYDLDLATDIDPAFLDAYTSGANLLAVVRDDVDGAKHLLDKAERFRKEQLPNYPEFFRKAFWSQAWYPAFILGYIYIFELHDLPKGAAAFEEVARIEGAPDFAARLTSRFKKKGGQYDVGIKLLTFMIEGARAEEVRVELSRKRDSLMIAQYLFQANDEFRFFLKGQPGYREEQQISRKKIESYWEDFRRQRNVPLRDPWGGLLSISPEGSVVTSTPYDKVFGLE